MKKNGFSLVEVMVSVSLFGLLGVGLLELFSGSLRFFSKTASDIDLSNENANAMRYVTSQLRSATSIQILNNGTRIDYQLPRLSQVSNPITGEKEILIPVISDGINRSFIITNGQLVDSVNSKVLAKNISSVDPDPKSTQYGQIYAPFQLTTIGSRRAVSVNLISAKEVMQRRRYIRMKDTVILRNGQ